jgi:formylglycine-generating enzyme required for sulfatase activity
MRKRDLEPTEIESVRLGPVFGISPETYVPALLAAALLVVLFLVLVYPGLRENGAQVSFVTVPEGASVHVDGTRVGATPLEVFVERGTRSVTFKRPFFDDYTTEVEIPGRVVGSLIAPARTEVRAELVSKNIGALAAEAARRFNRWALVGEANAQYQFDPVLSDAVLDLTAARQAGNTEADDLARKLLAHALRDVDSEALLTDYLRAVSFAEGSGSVFGGIQAAAVMSRIAAAVEANPALAYLVAAALPEDLSEDFRSTGWYEEATQTLVTTMLTATEEGGPQVGTVSTVEVAGHTFIEIPGRTFVMGLDGKEAAAGGALLQRPHIAAVEPFFIMETEVTRRLYQRFVRERPEWAPEAREELVDAGRADGDYLKDWSDGSGTDQSSRPVRFVSHYAATAFCDWLEQQLPPALEGWDVRLPTEAEWEWAAVLNGSEGYDAVFADAAMSTPLPVGSSEPGKLGVYDLFGNLWEWTADWYHPAEYLVRGTEARTEAFDGTQRVVRGGSWANDRRQMSVRTRGSQPPSWGTPFLGFRPVISERR